MIKRIFFLALLQIFVTGIYLQAQVDTKALSILNALRDKTKLDSTINVDFNFSIINVDNEVEETGDGNLKLKGDKYKATLFEQEIYCDGIKIITYNSSSNSATRMNVSDLDPGEISPQNLYTIYESGFKSKLKEEKTEGGIAIAVIDLFPLDPKSKDYTIVRIEIDQTNNLMRQALIKGKDGKLYVYKVLKTETNITIENTVFIFDETAHPDVEIVDY